MLQTTRMMSMPYDSMNGGTVGCWSLRRYALALWVRCNASVVDAGSWTLSWLPFCSYTDAAATLSLPLASACLTPLLLTVFVESLANASQSISTGEH